MIVTSRIHSFSRWSVAGWPWTPTLATRPPGPDEVGAELERLGHADRLDRDVGAEAAGQLHDPLDRVLGAVVDRHVGAELERLLEPRASARSIATIRPGVYSFAVRIAARPIGPAPTIATVSPGCDAAVQHADLERGREDVGEEQHLLVAQLVGDLVDGGVGERHPRELGLQAVDQVAEDPASAAGAEAVAALPAEAAAAARGDAGDEHAVAGLERRDRVADLDDRADGLVAEDRAGLHLGHVALEDVQVGAADRGRVDADDRVRRLLDGRDPGPRPRRARRDRGRRELSWLLLSL